jgi:glucosamine--fructose-6-phosphate aminotransferase (isomerizing)
MCGIVGSIGKAEVAPLLLDGLKRLEYRGYDSAGLATLVGGKIERRRAEGKLANLAARLKVEPLPGSIGIAHTRWATHGRPNEANAHPHATARVAIVHNGIIENFQELRDELEDVGCRFETETDTEAVAHLLTHYLDQGLDPEMAMAKAMPRLRGAFSLGILIADRPDIMIGARRGSPLAVGYGDGEMYLGSDATALAPYTDRICYLREDDWVVLSREGATTYNAGKRVDREVKKTTLSGAVVGKGNHAHFMMKEIVEQPVVIGETLRAFLNPLRRCIELPALPVDLAKLTQLTIVGCGSAYLAGFVAKYWLERIARLPVELDIASEFRYREAPMRQDGATLVISQSGETADTLAALKYAKD